MHGRLKVKTTAQQEAEKKAQRQEKLEAYQKAMKVIFDLRKSLQVENSPKVRLSFSIFWSKSISSKKIHEHLKSFSY